MRAWDDTEELLAGATFLLEASAGTGKTFQIASLVLRLVVEHGVPIDRVLAITFTNAATAELRDRVRARLHAALVTARTASEPPGEVKDAMERHLLAAVPRERVVQRLELALRSFDLAPISTIHGFSQRMLQELAFDSRQDPGLEPAPDADEIVAELVDDTLACLYAEASPAELAVLEGAGVTRARLVDVAKRMSGATAPAVLPTPPAVPEGAHADVLAEARREAGRWAARVAAMRATWAAGGAARDALVADTEAGRFKNGRVKWMTGWLGTIEGWLDGGAGPVDADETAFARLRAADLAATWKGAPGDVSARPYWPLVEALDAFLGDHAAFHAGFAPLTAFAVTARARVEAELERRRVLTFDAMLSRLAERAAPGDGDDTLAARIRARFDAVFVDEFQDTDAAQWAVIRAAFLEAPEDPAPRPRLFLIGDPKQAIYAFRGADVHVYLEAARRVAPSRRRTMVDNWRSDARAVHANNALFRAGSRPFDEAAIDYVHVNAKKPDRLAARGAPCGLDVRWVDARARGGDEGQPIGAKAVGLAARLAAREVVAWLDGARGELLREDDRPPTPAPGDLAVLVNGHHEAAAVVRELGRAGVPAVAAAKASVFDTEVAAWLAAWLGAVAGAGRDRAARTAAVSPLFGWTAVELAWALAHAGGEGAAADARLPEGVAPRAWDAWIERLHEASERWGRLGFARTFDGEASLHGVLPRVLALPGGERHATDLRHLFELCHVEERTHRHGPGALADWLRAQRGAVAEAAAQRLESDALAVKVETVHASKGLEYPVVLLPFGWSARAARDVGAPLAVHADVGPALHVGPPGTAGRDDAHARATAEERREALRKQYVALTRARHRTVAWYGPIGRDGAAASATALGRLLLRDGAAPGFDDGAMPSFEKKTLAEAWPKARARLDALARGSEGAIRWSAEPPLDAPPRWSPASRAPAPLACAMWPEGRATLVGPWAVTSFTSLAAGSAAPDRDERLRADAAIEAAAPGPRRADATPFALDRPPVPDLGGHALPRLERGRGTAYGTCVHEVLEALDFSALAARDGRPLAALVDATAARLGLSADAPLRDELAALLPAVLATPLDAAGAVDPVRGLPDGFALRDLAAADRLDELAFDLRLGAGTAFRLAPDDAAAGDLRARPGCVDPAAVYEAILAAPAARRPGVAPWAAHLAARRDAGLPLVQSVAGILTGSIDLVFRAGPDGARRYYLADYKTNRVGDSTPGHYGASWLEHEMAKAGYPLQALVYTLALHRHLAQRLPGYDYDRDVGGYLYLFLRGMAGPGTPRDPASGRCLGVFGDRWPRETVEALDRALSGAQNGADR